MLHRFSQPSFKRRADNSVLLLNILILIRIIPGCKLLPSRNQKQILKDKVK
jgi:hypothetical protein